MHIKQYDYKRQYSLYSEEYEKKAIEVLRSGWYTLGNELNTFEEEWAKYNGTKYCIGVANGLDAITLSLRSIGISDGDEVIVPVNTYIASALAVTQVNATPIFVDCDEYYGIDCCDLENKITDKTKAVVIVHLYGMPCDMDQITSICQKYNLALVEDCAQSHGAKYKEEKTGTFGYAGCFSFFPTKNLGGFGDGGCVITNDSWANERIRKLRNYGSSKRYHHDLKGVNSRLDEIQASLILVKLKHIGFIIQRRKEIAFRYSREITNPYIVLPQIRPNTESAWHQYVVRCNNRGKLITYLEENGIETYIHYPIPLHLSGAYSDMKHKKGNFARAEQYADEILSLPMYESLTDEDMDYIIDKMNRFIC